MKQNLLLAVVCFCAGVFVGMGSSSFLERVEDFSSSAGEIRSEMPPHERILELEQQLLNAENPKEINSILQQINKARNEISALPVEERAAASSAGKAKGVSRVKRSVKIEEKSENGPGSAGFWSEMRAFEVKVREHAEIKAQYDELLLKSTSGAVKDEEIYREFEVLKKALAELQ